MSVLCFRIGSNRDYRSHGTELVEQHRVRDPHIVWRQRDVFNVVVKSFVPSQTRIDPRLLRRRTDEENLQMCHVSPRTGNIVGHNVAAAMCPRFAGALGIVTV